jgi:hypothetical protein
MQPNGHTRIYTTLTDTTNMRRPGPEQTGRAAMCGTVLVEQDIGCLSIVELIDFEAPLVQRQVPSEKVDKDVLAGCKHCGKRRPGSIGFLRQFL